MEQEAPIKLCEFLERFKDWDTIKILLFTRCKAKQYEHLFKISYMNFLRYKLVLRSLEDSFPKAIIYKGFWSNFFLYRYPGERFISDVDLLLLDEDYERAKNVLLERGFRKIDLVPRMLEFLEWEAPMFKGKILIELHRRPFPQYYLDIPSRKFFKRALRWFGNFLRLPYEDNLILNVLHFHKSTRRSPIWLVDTVLLLEKVDRRKLEDTLRYYNIDKQTFESIVASMLKLELTWESPFYKHGFIFREGRLKRILIYVLLKSLKRLKL